VTDNWQQRIVSLANNSLYAELECYPKAGLVSLVDIGSHRDMDHHTFLASIKALDDYWMQMVELGIKNAPFSELVVAGLAAEYVMLSTTNGVNTHRGAIFIVGILVAVCAVAYVTQAKFAMIPDLIRNLWGDSILKHHTNKTSHGQRVRDRYSLSNNSDIIQHAAGGFEDIFSQYLPLLKEFYPRYDEAAYIQLFYYILSQVQDTNLLYRGGLVGLEFAQAQAQKFISSGGIMQYDWLLYAQSIHQQFITRNLSPGGCADLLAATIFVYHAEVELWG
jgi:triphosphoribosyl-dephospho-CoA synthase